MNWILEQCCWLYNHLLEQRRDAWKTEGKSISLYQQHLYIKQLKNENDNFYDIFSQTLQNTAKRVDLAFQSFFRRCKTPNEKPGYPRFKSKDRYHSFTYPQYGRYKYSQVKDNKIYLPKVGPVKIKYHRSIKGQIKIATVKKSATGKWYVYS